MNYERCVKMKRILRKIFAYMMSVICMMTFLTIWDETDRIDNKVLADEEDIWKLVWDDEFDGDSLDLTKWNNEGATGRNGWGNQELQDYQMEYSEVKDGKFIIKPQFQWNAATKELVDNSVYSTRVWTKGLYSVKYGKIEFRAKMPKGQGTWANAWMLGNEYDWPQCGEIDVASTVNSDKNIINQSIHCPKFNSMPTSSGNKGINAEIPDSTTAYHTYGIIWTENKITFTIDGKNTLTYDPSLYSATATEDINVWPFNQPFYMIFDCAVGGTLGGEVTPNGWTEIARDGDIVTYEDYYTIDWIRIYEANDFSKNETENIIELSANAYRTEGNIQIDINSKASEEVDGYQIKISNDKYFSDDAGYQKTITSKNEEITFILNQPLDTDCVYIKVRAYTLIDGTKKYGDWSEELTVYLPEGDETTGDSDEQLNNVEWSIDEGGTLNWSGGNVNEDGYSLEDEIPWYEQKDKIKNVVVGEGVDHISDYTFMYCENLETITIPAGVKSIGPFAFWGCNNLKSINVATDNPNYISTDGVLFNKNKTEIVIYPSAKEGKYVIPNTVTAIGENSFRECRKLSDLVIPDSVTAIGAYAFYDCTSLLNVTIPKSVTKMKGCGLGLLFYKGGDDIIKSFVMKGYSGTVAEGYARDNGLTFEDITDVISNPETTTASLTKPIVQETTTLATDKSNDNLTQKKVATTKIKKIKKAKKSLKVTWKKVKGVSGYQIQYSTSSKFKKAKKITIKNAKTTSKTIKKLKVKKKYYVRIRTYITVNGKKKYSSWSKKKSQKTK